MRAPTRERSKPRAKEIGAYCGAMTSRPAGGHILQTEEARSRIRERPALSHDCRGEPGPLDQKGCKPNGLAITDERPHVPGLSSEQMKRGLAASAILGDARA